MGCGCGKKKAARPAAKRAPTITTTQSSGVAAAKVYQSANTARGTSAAPVAKRRTV